MMNSKTVLCIQKDTIREIYLNLPFITKSIYEISIWGFGVLGFWGFGVGLEWVLLVFEAVSRSTMLFSGFGVGLGWVWNGFYLFLKQFRGRRRCFLGLGWVWGGFGMGFTYF